MFWQRLFLLGVLVMPPLLVVGGCGGSVSGPNSMTEAGLGTVIVKVAYGGDVVVFLDGKPVPSRNGRAIFYNITPGRHDIRASSPSVFNRTTTVNVRADKTVTVTISPPETPTPFATPFGN